VTLIYQAVLHLSNLIILIFRIEKKMIVKLCRKYPEYEILLKPDFDSLKRYKIMMKILENKGMFTPLNLKQNIQIGGIDPPTFGDVKLDENGEQVAAETALTHKSDQGVLQSIDYIFEVI
jgi:hypothetical protein